MGKVTGARDGKWYRALTSDDVCWIKYRILEGSLTLTEIAGLAGTSMATVSLIKNGHMHKNVGPDMSALIVPVSPRSKGGRPRKTVEEATT
jgi:hypothetical protein